MLMSPRLPTGTRWDYMNLPGSYMCQCDNGYQLGADGHTCEGLLWNFLVHTIEAFQFLSVHDNTVMEKELAVCAQTQYSCIMHV